MNDRLFHAVTDDSLKEEVMNSDVLSLVKELNHVYDLKVYRKSVSSGYGGFTMCNAEGFAIAKVFTHEGAYCYHSPFQQKERGSDDFDRHTFRSKKLSTLMTTLKKAKVATTTEGVLRHHARYINDMVMRVSSTYEDINKGGLPADRAQYILQAMVDGKSFDSLTQTDRDLYLHILDEYKKIDIMKDVKKKGVETMFKDCYLIFGDSMGQYIVAESTFEYKPAPNSGVTKLTITPTTSFKRVKHLTDYPTALTTLTMLKVSLGDEFRPYSHLTDSSLFPLGDKYISDLDVVYGYQNRNGDFDMGYLCLSK